ncbi:MAG: zinc ribbon domain-containing protein [Actinobacteria bacterium]|nr:zinc ribbon domain-containing protein [Actinomycetota bacterium]
MPTYEYKCEAEHLFEVFQSFQDKAIDTCPECGAPARKVYSNVGVVFKGSGFYKTDSKAKPETKSETKSESKSETKSESKAPTKSEN